MRIKEIDLWLEIRDVVVNDIGEILDDPMVRELFNAAVKEDDASYSMYHLLKEIDMTVNDLQPGEWFRIAFAVKHGGIDRGHDLKVLLNAGVEYGSIYIYEARHTQEGVLMQCLYSCDGEAARLYLDTFFDDDGNLKVMTKEEMHNAYKCLYEQMKKED